MTVLASLARVTLPIPAPAAAFDRAARGGFLAGLLVGSRAAALLDDTGHVLELSEDEHLILTSTLAVQGGRLIGRTRDASRRMNLMLDGLLGGAPAGRTGLAILPAPSGPPAVVRGQRVCDGFFLPRVAVILTFPDPGSTALPDAALLHNAFGLTTSEAAVALGIAAGQDLREIAAARGIVVPTVRSHLKSVFGKTQTHRQSALVALLLSLRMPGIPGGGRAFRPMS